MIGKNPKVIMPMNIQEIRQESGIDVVPPLLILFILIIFLWQED